MSKKTPLTAFDILNAGPSLEKKENLEEGRKKPLAGEVKKPVEKKEVEKGATVAVEKKSPLKQKTEASNDAKIDPPKEEQESTQPFKPVIQVRGKKEDENTRRTFYMNKQVLKQLDDMSEQTGVPKGTLITEALKYYFSQVEIKE